MSLISYFTSIAVPKKTIQELVEGVQIEIDRLAGDIKAPDMVLIKSADCAFVRNDCRLQGFIIVARNIQQKNLNDPPYYPALHIQEAAGSDTSSRYHLFVGGLHLQRSYISAGFEMRYPRLISLEELKADIELALQGYSFSERIDAALNHKDIYMDISASKVLCLTKSWIKREKTRPAGGENLIELYWNSLSEDGKILERALEGLRSTAAPKPTKRPSNLLYFPPSARPSNE